MSGERDIKEALGKAALDALSQATAAIEERKKSNIKINNDESNFKYIDRILDAMLESLELKGITLVFTSKAGNHFMTSKGTAAPIKLLNYGEESQ